MTLTTERQKIRHLLRRTGFGASPAEVDAYAALGLAGAVDRLLNPQNVDDSATDGIVATRRVKAQQDRQALFTLWHARIALTQRPLLEKLTYFWHDHFATGLNKVNNNSFMLVQNETLRAGALGRFRDLLLAVTRDPAMMVWLDNRQNVASAPNENYAREMLELFTLGEGVAYTERDVKEAARALTGWKIVAEKRDPQDDNPYPTGVVITPKQHDDRAKTVLGRTGRWGDEDVMRIISERPECAAYIGRKLWQWFAVPDPTPAMIARTSAAYFADDTSIRSMLRVVLLSNEMYSPAAYRWRIQSPVEYVAGTLRMLGLVERGGKAFRDTQAMGQVLFDPPNVGGWPGGEAWVNSNTVLARANFANDVTRIGRPGQSVDVAGMLRAVGATASAAQVVDHLLDLVVGGDVDSGTRGVLIEHLGGANHFNFAQAEKAGTLQGVLYLILTMPLAHLS